ncbi:MAG: NAD(P)H-hydrate dehydratase [Actinobacteria bacterium]|nr:NAD(P)H-hydrate dehydratase [Actinomycetota bacterium]
MQPSRILKGSRVAEIDSACISDGIDSKWLMSNAGRGVSGVVLDDFKMDRSNKQIKGVIVCGGGNNGGDGFVAAMDLIEKGMDICVFCIHPAEKFSDDSRFYFDRLAKHKNTCIRFLDFEDEAEKADFIKKAESADFLVDAIFGTGLHGKDIYGQAKEVIDCINYIKYSRKEKNENLEIYSIDIPSGIDSDNAKVLGAAVRADKTVTFGCKKFGCVCYPGRQFCGDIVVFDIGIPEKYFNAYEQFFEADIYWAASKIPLKENWTYKHAVGKLLVIAGSIGYTGAAAMTCQSALRAGAGIVTLVCPWELNSIFEVKLTEVMTYPVEQTDDISIHINAFEEIRELAEKFDALAVGPGLSRNPSTIRLVREILKHIKKPTVLDADGLRALYGPREIDGENNFDLSHLVITPHSGELASILGREKIGLEERLEASLEVVKKYNLVSVLKGAATLITNHEQITYINPTGSWALATAGTGDILTGIIGSFLAQGMGLFEAAVCGTFIHGYASDIMACKTSRTSQIATDLLEGLKQTFLEIERIRY